MRRFIPALVVSAMVVGMAPYAGVIRDRLSTALAGGFVRVMGAGFAVVVAVVVVWVVARIRDHRLARYAMLLLGLALLVGQLLGWSRDNAAVNAVERIHFLYYGLLGFLWLRAYRRGRADLSAPLLALDALLLVAIADEGVQWWVAGRTGELYDVGLDVYAGATGVLLALALDGPRSIGWRFANGAGRSLARLGAVAVVATAAFLQAAHLGYRIDDPEVGTFRSFFDEAGLRAASRDRAARWAAHPLGPPGSFRPLEAEDWFRTEAGMRVQHRNYALEHGDVYQAWKENLLLEHWYAPFLDQLNRDGNPFRLPEPTRRELEARRPKRDPYRYDSPVGRVPLRIWLRPTRTELWSGTAVVVGILLAASAIASRRGRRPSEDLPMRAAGNE
jgi:hypothetical protein